jgi:hypothetical protein
MKYIEGRIALAAGRPKQDWRGRSIGTSKQAMSMQF